MGMDSKIFKARKELRVIYDKYIKEFHDIHLKIDSYLEKLQTQNEDREKEVEDDKL